MQQHKAAGASNFARRVLLCCTLLHWLSSVDVHRQELCISSGKRSHLMLQQKAVCDLHPCQQLLCQWPQALQQVGQRQLQYQLPYQLQYQLPYQLQYQLQHRLVLQPQMH